MDAEVAIGVDSEGEEGFFADDVATAGVDDAAGAAGETTGRPAEGREFYACRLTTELEGLGDLRDAHLLERAHDAAGHTHER